MNRLRQLIHEIYRRSLWPVLGIYLVVGCSGSSPGSTVLTADMPLHLEDRLDAATIIGSDIPADMPAAVEWHFDDPRPEWTSTRLPPERTPGRTRTANGLRLSVDLDNRGAPGGPLRGAIYVDLPDWNRADWGHVLIRARTSENVSQLGLAFNLREDTGTEDGPFRFGGEGVDVISDGTVQTYLLAADWSPAWQGAWEGPWRQLAIEIRADEPAAIDILSVRVIPKEADYAAAPTGVRTEVRTRTSRRALYMHAPGRVEYRVRVPEAGRLDVGLGVLRQDDPVTFRVSAARGDQSETLLEENYADQELWAQRTVDLSGHAGQLVTLRLEADAERTGAVALWAAPTLTGHRTTEGPNVIFYIIDGGAADYMSVYGYDRPTTPNVERLAVEGAVFERAYSNSSWTKPSTASFMTSLHNSVLGGIRGSGSDPVPEKAVTMAEHMHQAGYQTAVFVSNPYAGSLSNLERGVDVFRDAGVTPPSRSSAELHEDYWRWRGEYPAEPYWVHFQTTDVHPDFEQRRDPVAPFAGLFISPAERETFYDWQHQLAAAAGFTHAPWLSLEAIDETGISYTAFHDAARSLYDENMAHQDYQLGRLVEGLKARGEWGHTLLIVAADHASAAAHVPDPFPPTWGPLFTSSVTRVPLIVVWPDRIAAGQRFTQPVSMIDMLPTILDLSGLPMPEVVQGQSLGPLLLGEEGWEPRPVILDEFAVDDTGELSGYMEVIDGRWGASLLIDASLSSALAPDVPKSRIGDGYESLHRRPVPLVLYDLWDDPHTQHSLHEERPDLVERYTEFLLAQFEAHRSLAQFFTSSSDQVALTPQQLRTLRSLGYIN